MNLDDLEAAYRLHKENGKSKMELHLFVVGELLAKAREAIEMTDLERDARHFMKGRRA